MKSSGELPERFRLYGRVCESSLSLAALAPSTVDAPDIEFSIEDLGATEPDQWIPCEDSHENEPLVARAARDDDEWLRFSDETRFRIRRGPDGRREIGAMPGPGVPDDTVQHYLVDEVLPDLLSASGSLVLHGAAVSLDGRALVLLGGSGMGKSTLSASLSRRGFPLLTDDCAVIDTVSDGYLVQPSYHSVRLWPPGARRVFGEEPEESDPVAHFTAKRRYRGALTFADRAVPLLGIVSIDHPSPSQPERIAIDMVAGQEALGLVTLGVKSVVGGGVGRSRDVLLDLIELSDRVPIARLVAPEDPALVPVVCDALVDWAQHR